MDATEVRERAAFWGALCKLLLLMPSPEQSLPSAALPEDWQLRAFGPLNAAHQHLDFQLPRAEKVHRLLIAQSDAGSSAASIGVEIISSMTASERHT